MNNKVFEQIKKCTTDLKQQDVAFETKKEVEAFYRKYHEPIKKECDFSFFCGFVLERFTI